MTTDKPARRWDPIVKLTHWGVVGAVVANATLFEPGSQRHIQIGYAMAALLLLRWLWGFIGPRSARFTSFLPSIGKTVDHLRAIAGRRDEPHMSHNPLGSWMVFAIWATLAVVAASGIAMSTGVPVAAPAPVETASAPYAENRGNGEEEGEEQGEERGGEGHEGTEGGEGEEMLEEVHEAAVNLLYLLIALHLCGVVFETVRSRGRILRDILPGG